MSKLCTISIIGLYLLLVTQITHSFVLLTANVEDVKKIARKFVSDSLADRITNFLAKATETLVKNSEENKAEDSSQVSAENRMYNVEKAINDGLDNIRNTKEQSTVAPQSLDTENGRHKEVEHTTAARSKNKHAKLKILDGRSRYIKPVKRAKPTENNDKYIEKKDTSSYPSAPEDKKNNNYKTKKRFKLLSAFDSDTTTTAATTGIPTVANKAKIDEITEKDNKSSENPKRSMRPAIAAGRESDYYDTDKEHETEKAVNEFNQNDVTKNQNSERNVNKFDQYETGNNKNTKKSANNYAQYDILKNRNTETEDASAPISEKDESDNEINNIIPTDEEVVTRGSLVKEKELNDDKWWKKELTTRIQYDADVQAEGKSWF